MNKILYPCLKGLLFVVSLIPLRVGYIFADIMYFLLNYVIRYRKKVIEANIKLVFPTITDKEVKNIRNKYYKHLSDFFIESVYSLYISERQLRKRVHFINPELVNEYYQQGKSIIGVTGHYANWEWGYTFPLYCSHKLLAVYKKLDNKLSDQLFIDIRSRFGGVPIEMSNVLRRVVAASQKKPVMAFLVADQSPAGIPNWHYTTFLGITGTPVFTGPEKIARVMDAVFMFIEIQKVKRGYYTIKFVTLCENSKQTEPNQLTDQYLRYMEKIIYNKPEYWMWSHKRWKRRKTE